MEDMYGKVGKQLNYLSKIGKSGNKLTSRYVDKNEKEKAKVVGMSKLKNNLRKVISNFNIGE